MGLPLVRPHDPRLLVPLFRGPPAESPIGEVPRDVVVVVGTVRSGTTSSSLPRRLRTQTLPGPLGDVTLRKPVSPLELGNKIKKKTVGFSLPLRDLPFFPELF